MDNQISYNGQLKLNGQSNLDSRQSKHGQWTIKTWTTDSQEFNNGQFKFRQWTKLDKTQATVKTMNKKKKQTMDNQNLDNG